MVVLVMVEGRGGGEGQGGRGEDRYLTWSSLNFFTASRVDMRPWLEG